VSEPSELATRLGALESKLDHLTTLVESLVSTHDSPATADDEQALWRRLGLTEGERRIVTVLFADVSGFTELSEQLDPEAFQLVMRDTMGVMAACVAEEGGTLEKFIGDALCALFGAPVAHVDEPERAARAALTMHAALAERAKLRPDLPALEVHVGINTGPVIAGTVGDGSQFGVMGDTINAAARLMNLAQHGETFVSAETARRLRHAFRLEDRGLHEVKGKSKPLAVAALLAELGPEERADARRLRAPLVGRDSELANLRRLAAQAAEGDGVTVVLVGEDGTGASRVAEELTTGLIADGWRILSASARVQAETPLGMVATALGPLLAERPGELAGGTAGPLAETLLAGGAAAPHDFELILGEVVTAAARETPLLVLLDDADEADPGSIEMIRYLSRSTGDERVLWLLTGNDVPPPFQPLVGTSDVVVLRLPPLPDEAVGTIFDSVFPGALTPVQRARLAHLAEGNVQYAMEIALALVDDGVLVELDDGRWTAVGDVDSCELPGSVAELLEARIDQLSTAARVTLQDASVIGQRFSRRLLERVATIPTSVDASLAELVEEQLVMQASDQAHHGMWAFRSRLVREVAYDSVLKRRRPAAHRAVAEALLVLEPERIRENADLLAHHFEESDDPPLALPHLVEAVNTAELTYNLTGALDRSRRALRLRDRFPGRVGDDQAAWLLRRVGINKLLLGDRTGLAELEEAVELLAASGASPAALAALEEQVGWYLTVDGQREAATPHLQHAQAIAEEQLSGDARTSVLAAVAASRAFNAGAMGELAVGLAAVDGAEVEARSAGDVFAQARADLVGGVLRLWAGDAAGAAHHLRVALDLAWANVFASIADRCGRWLVNALVDAGRGAEAEELARPILARADDRGDPTVACGVRAALAKRWRQDGDLARAGQLAAEAEAVLTDKWVAPDAASDTRLVLAQLALDGVREDPDAESLALAVHEAERHLAAVVAQHESDPWLEWRSEARIALIRGRIALLRGDTETAIASAAGIRAAVTRAGAKRELVAADLMEGEARLRAGDAAGHDMITKAMEAAAALGAPWLVTSSQGALARSTVPTR
jgi:class 3 adenylate cyclase